MVERCISLLYLYYLVLYFCDLAMCAEYIGVLLVLHRRGRWCRSDLLKSIDWISFVSKSPEFWKLFNFNCDRPSAVGRGVCHPKLVSQKREIYSKVYFLVYFQKCIFQKCWHRLRLAPILKLVLQKREIYSETKFNPTEHTRWAVGREK